MKILRIVVVALVATLSSCSVVPKVKQLIAAVLIKEIDKAVDTRLKVKLDQLVPEVISEEQMDMILAAVKTVMADVVASMLKKSSADR